MYEDQGQNIIDTLLNAKNSTVDLKTSQDELNASTAAYDASPAVAMKQAFSDMQTSLAPLLTSIAELVTKIAEWVQNNPTLAATIAAVASAIGIIVGAAIALAPIFTAISAAAGVLGVSIGAISLPILAIIAAIGLLVAAGVLIYKNWDEISSYATEVWGSIKDFLSDTWNSIKETSANVWNSITDFFKQWGPTVLTVITGPIGMLVKLIYDNWNSIKSTTSSVWNGIKTFLSGLWNGIKSVASSVWNGIKSTITTVSNGIKSVITTVWNAAKSVVTNAVNGIKSIVSNVFNTLKSVVSTAMNNVKSAIQTGWNNAVSFLKGINLASIGKNIIQGLANGIGSMAGAIRDKVKAIADSVTSTIRKVLDIHSPSRVTHKLGEQTGDGFKNGINSKSGEIKKAAKDAATAAKKAFNEQMDKADYKFKMGQINSSQYISQLREIRSEYAKTPEQVRKVNLEIKSIQDNNAKEIKALQKKEFNDALKTIKDKAAAGKLSADQELKQLQSLASNYKKNSNERLQIDKEMKKVKDKLSKEQFDNEKTLIENKKYYNQLSLIEELADYQKYVKEYKKGSDERTYYEKEIYRVKQEIQQQVDKINEDYLSKVKTLNQQLIDGEKALNDEYDKALSDRENALRSFAGIFDEVTKKDVSGDQLLQNLKGQVTAFEDWQKNISELASKGIDDGLLSELRDMGPKAGDEIAALNTLTDEKLQEYVGLWKEKNSLAKEEALKELEGLNPETNGKIDELKASTAAKLLEYQEEWRLAMVGVKGKVKDESKEMPSIGQFAVAGLIDGLLAKKQELISTAKSIAKAIKDTLKGALDIHSPSRVMRELGGFVGDGLSLGIKDSIRGVQNATQQMAAATIPTINSPSTAMAGGMQNITIMLDREVIGRAVAPTVAREITVRAWR